MLSKETWSPVSPEVRALGALSPSLPHSPCTEHPEGPSGRTTERRPPPDPDTEAHISQIRTDTHSTRSTCASTSVSAEKARSFQGQKHLHPHVRAVPSHESAEARVWL